MKRIIMTLSLLSILAGASASDSVFTKFVSRRGDKLMDETGELRFISFNVPTLHYNEDNLPFTETNPWQLTNEFEIADALKSVRQMGGRVVRIYTLSVHRAGEDPNIPCHVIGPNKSNEEAYKSLDMVMAIANRKGIRIIFPFIDNARWWGGIEACAAFRGKYREDFWTDPNLFEDYKAIVNSVINRTNSVTGVKYRDDKAILAWETGNELMCPPEWALRAAAYIKSIDKNHLVMDGYHINPVREESIKDENIDMVTTHYYPVMFKITVTPADMIAQIKSNAAMARGKKVYLVGEFGFIPTTDVEKLLQTVMDEKICGALIWSLRFHDRAGGFYQHSEPHGGDIYKAYHWPGFASGSAYDETALLALMRKKAFAISGLPIPPVEKPDAPTLLAIKDVAAISWQGSAGAQSYTIERSESEKGPWVIAGSDISDAAYQYRPLFNDTDVEVGKSYYYRVTAKNSAGVSKPSNTIGPVAVSCKTLVDEMQDFKFIDKKNGTLSIETKETRKFKEDAYRLKGMAGNYIVYKVEQPIAAWKLYSFFPPQAVSDFKFYISADGQNFSQAEFARRDYFSGQGDYNYFSPVLYESTAGTDARFLKIEYTGDAQIARVEIKYGKQN